MTKDTYHFTVNAAVIVTWGTSFFIFSFLEQNHLKIKETTFSEEEIRDTKTGCPVGFTIQMHV